METSSESFVSETSMFKAFELGDFTLESVMKEEGKTIYQKLEILASQKDFHNKFLDVKFFMLPQQNEVSDCRAYLLMTF